MRKKLFAAAILAISAAAATPAFAQQNNCNTQNCNQESNCITEQCQPNCNDKRDCNRPCPFDGLNLSAAQKDKLKQLNSERKQEACQKRDAACKARAEQGKSCRKDYLQKVKEILSPEQYVQFLENNYVNVRRDASKKLDKMRGDFHHKKGNKEIRKNAEKVNDKK